MFIFLVQDFSHLVRWPTIYICGNKDADQLRVNREADLCFFYTDSTLLLLLGSEILIFYPASARVQPDLLDLFGNHVVGFLTRRLIYCLVDGLICRIILYDT